MDWSKIYQIGIVVSDIDAAVERFRQVGIGPFTRGPSSEALDRCIYGKLQPDVKVNGAIAKLGSLELELLQPVSGLSAQQVLLDEFGEHVIHLCAYSDDLEHDKREMASRGYETISEGRFTDGGRFAYFDTKEALGVTLELFETGLTE